MRIYNEIVKKLFMKGKNKFINSSFWSGKRILITGNTGFKGTWLSVWLSMKGAKVYGFSLDITKENFFYSRTMEGKELVKD